MEAATQAVTVRDIEVQVVRVGRGSPLVVCGGPQLGHPYLRSLDVLADEREVVYYDSRGSGRTEVGDPSQLSFAGAIADLEGLRDALGIDRFSILGHSLGGHTSYLYASRYPDHVESLILVDVGPPLTDELAMQLGAAMRAQRTAADDADLQRIGASAAFQAREPKAVEDFILNIYAPFFRDRSTIPTVDLGFTQITAANVVDYEDRLVATLADQDPQESLSRISCPTLVVHGEVDPIPLEFSRFLADRIPGAQLAIIPGASHFPFIEDRDAFKVVVGEFLTKRT
ncbi:MAG: alpha/beta hydrolase [Chloroflexota bacterium]